MSGKLNFRYEIKYRDEWNEWKNCSKMCEIRQNYFNPSSGWDSNGYDYVYIIYVYIMYIHTCKYVYNMCSRMCNIFCDYTIEMRDNILHVRVCTVNARKLVYKGHSWLWIRTNGRFVSSVMTRVWLAYHDDEDDDWMNRFALTIFPPLRRPPNRKSREIPDRKSEQLRSRMDGIGRASGAAKIVFASWNCIHVRGKWIKEGTSYTVLHLYSFEIVIGFRIRFEIKHFTIIHNEYFVNIH